MLTNFLGSSFLIIAVFVIRALFARHTSRRFIYALWLIVLVRLLMPMPIFDLDIEIPLPISHDIGETTDRVTYYPPITAENTEISQAPTTQITTPPQPVFPQPVEKNIDWAKVFNTVHIAGAGVLALWFCYVNISLYTRLKKDRIKLETSHNLPVYKTNMLTTPCLFGVVKPAIYLTEAACNERHINNVITHEMCHYRHWDNIWNFLGMVCVVMWWWNPLVWLSFFTAKRDGELACDELALEILGENGRIDYGRTLIEMAQNRPHNRLSVAATISGGAKEMKERIMAIANKRKNVLWAVAVVAVIAVLCTVIGFSGAEMDKDDVIEKTSAQMLKSDIVQKAEQMLSQIIIDHEKGKYASGTFQTEDHEIIGIEVDNEGSPSKITFYMTVLYREYDFDYENNEPMGVAAGRNPTAVTFEVNNEKITLFDYWTPLNGKGYDTSIREKFPKKYWEQAFDNAGSQAQEARCFEKAVNYFTDAKPDEEIDALFDEIISSPMEHSDTASYILSHKYEYEKLLKLNKYTLSYAFRGFEAKSFGGLKAEIIASVCSDIIKAASENVPQDKYDQRYNDFWGKGFVNAYNWYSEMKKLAHQLLEDKGIEEVEKYDQWAELLLDISENMNDVSAPAENTEPTENIDEETTDNNNTEPDAPDGTYSYGIVTDVIEIDKAFNVTTTCYYIIDGNQGAYQANKALSVNTGVARFTMDNNSIVRIENLEPFDITSIESKKAVANGKKYDISSDVQVYLHRNNTYSVTNLAEVSNNDDYALSGYADGKVRVIIVEKLENLSAYTPVLIKSFDGSTMVVDPVEYITTADTERIAELELDPEFDLPSGYYIHNATEESLSLDVLGAVFEFVDWNRQFTKPDADLFYETSSAAEFLEYCGTYDVGIPSNTPFFLNINGNKLQKLKEIILA